MAVGRWKNGATCRTDALLADLSGRIGDRDIDAGRVVLAEEKLGDEETTARENRLDGGGLLRGEGVVGGLAAMISALLVVVLVLMLVLALVLVLVLVLVLLLVLVDEIIVCVVAGPVGVVDRGDGLLVFLVFLVFLVSLGFFSSEISINDE